jgi:hypothetical protein
MSQNIASGRWIAVPGLIVAGILAAGFLDEWFTVGVVADPTVIDGYHFGSQAMVGNGGWYYATPDLYVTTMLAQGLVAAVLMVLFVFAATMRSQSVAMGAYALLAVGVFANQLFR